MSSARSRKKKSRSSVKLFPLYKHPQDAPPQRNPPQCQCIVGDFFACLGAWGCCPQQAFFACVMTHALLAGSESSVKRLLYLLAQLDCSVNRGLHDSEILLRAELQFVLHTLPLFAVLADKRRIKVPLRWELAYSYQLQHHRHTWNCAVQFDVRKIARVNMYLFCQRSARNSLCFPPCFYISSKGFKAGTVLDFSHIVSPTNIL